MKVKKNFSWTKESHHVVLKNKYGAVDSLENFRPNLWDELWKLTNFKEITLSNYIIFNKKTFKFALFLVDGRVKSYQYVPKSGSGSNVSSF